MKILVVGTGYVGLVTGTCLAEAGHSVCCIDVDAAKIAMLKNAESPIYEPGLNELLDRNIRNERLTFSTDIKDGIDGCEVAFIAVGTPPNEDGSSDLRYVMDVARDIATSMSDYMVVVNKSTVPVHTGQKVTALISEVLETRGADIDFDVVSNPEFLKEGSSVDDFLKPDRIIVGTSSERAEAVMKSVYQPFTSNGHPLLVMDVESAEMAKYAANAMLATRISFMNEISNLCEKVGANVHAVKKGIGLDPRIGPQFLNPGIGYGGSCFPKDVKSMIHTGHDYHLSMRILDAVEAVNYDQKQLLFKKMSEFFDGDVAGRTVAVWGLAFKPRTDDIREAPAIESIRRLLDAGCKVQAYDPVAMPNAKKELGDSVTFASSQYEALNGADCLFIFTEWPEFRSPNFAKMHDALLSAVIFDGRNVLDAGIAKKEGFLYFGIGIAPPSLDG